MAITGAWKARQSVEAGAAKQGTGINRVHWNHDHAGRNTAPGITDTPQDLPAELTTPYSDEGYVGEYYCGDGGYASGMDVRPALGVPTTLARTSTEGFPEWGEYEAGIPGGNAVRSKNHGADRNLAARVTPTETVTEGWLNKATSDVSTSVQSDVSQLYVNTSATQLHKTRNGSQVAGEGRASEQKATLAQRIPGKILKAWSGGERHYDMQPRQQNEVIRPWWNRQAGTVDPALLDPNSMYTSEPITREVPPDPYTGPTAGSLSASYGYQDEDVIPYA